MHEPNRYATTLEGLEALLASGRTGVLVSEAEPQGPRVYTMLGEIMAVVSERDGEALLERLVRGGHLNASRASELRRSIQQGGDSMALITAEVSGGEMRALGSELIRLNLKSFLGIAGPAWFESMAQLFVPGLQVAHDSEALLTEVKQLISQDRARDSKPLEVERQRSPAPPVQNAAPHFKRNPPPTTQTASDLSAFDDHDRHRLRGNGEFSVAKEHLDLVDLGADEVSSDIGAQPSGYSAPGLSTDQIIEKIEVCNQLLRAALAALTSTGSVAIPMLQALVTEPGTLFFESLGKVSQDIHGQLALDSLQHSLSLRSPSERRRMLENGLLDLMERTLDLCADELDEQSMEELLVEVAGFHQRLHS